MEWEEELEELKAKSKGHARVLTYPYRGKSDSKITKIFLSKPSQKKLKDNLSDQDMFYPDANQLNISSYLENLDLDTLRKIFEKAKGTACYLCENYDFSYEEIIVIRDAMLENPKLTFVGFRPSFYSLWIAFNRVGYGDEWLKHHQLIESPKWHALLFIG